MKRGSFTNILVFCPDLLPSIALTQSVEFTHMEGNFIDTFNNGLEEVSLRNEGY
jgi:hypothetical protein